MNWDDGGSSLTYMWGSAPIRKVEVLQNHKAATDRKLSKKYMYPVPPLGSTKRKGTRLNHTKIKSTHPIPLLPLQQQLPICTQGVLKLLNPL